MQNLSRLAQMLLGREGKATRIEYYLMYSLIAITGLLDVFGFNINAWLE